MPITGAADIKYCDVFIGIGEKIRLDISYESADDSHETSSLICFLEEKTAFFNVFGGASIRVNIK